MQWIGHQPDVNKQIFVCVSGVHIGVRPPPPLPRASGLQYIKYILRFGLCYIRYGPDVLPYGPDVHERGWVFQTNDIGQRGVRKVRFCLDVFDG